MKRSFSLDWNCAISVEKSEPSSDAIKALVLSHREGRSAVAVLQTSASENMRGTRLFPASYLDFEARPKGIGWDDLPRVKTPGVWGLSFWGASFYVDVGHYDKFASILWSKMFPRLPQRYEEFLTNAGLPEDTSLRSEEANKWRNAWCDVHSAYSHLWAKRDFFVTLNLRDFDHGDLRKIGLFSLGPSEALERV
jgi:hypothetical protein